MKLKYLGFGFYRDAKEKEWKSRPHQDSVKKLKRSLKKLTIRKYTMDFKERLKRINQVIRGWINYFALGSMKTAMTDIDAQLRTRLRVIIWKMWKAPSKRQWGLQKLGVENRYEWVVTKICIVRVISKEKLARSSLISCLDYYNECHALKLC